MGRLAVLVAAVLLVGSCSTVPVEKPPVPAPPPKGALFDAALVEGFVVGKTTQEEIRKALGEPYPDPLRSERRWTYKYTHRKQVVFSFEAGVLTGKQWSEEHGIGVPDD